jgi:hypothetical protein
MGVVALYFIDYVVEVCMVDSLHLHYSLSYLLSGARSALPMGVAPEAMVGDHSKIYIIF